MKLSEAGHTSNIEYWKAVARRYQSQRDMALQKVQFLQERMLEETGKAYDGNDWLRVVVATGARRNNPIHNFFRKLRRTFMPSYPDIDKIDTNIRHAKAIIELIMDNIGNKLDSDPDAIEFALWSAAKHLRQATDEIEDVGEKNLSELLSKVDPDPLGDDEESVFKSDDEDEQTNDDLVFEIRVGKDGEFANLERVYR
jgi:hypothetical protein